MTKSIPQLTPREHEVLDLLATGRSDQEIARLLTISVSTVDTHVGNIYRKLGASNRFECALLAVRCGLIDRNASVEHSANGVLGE